MQVVKAEQDGRLLALKTVLFRSSRALLRFRSEVAKQQRCGRACVEVMGSDFAMAQAPTMPPSLGEKGFFGAGFLLMERATGGLPLFSCVPCCT